MIPIPRALAILLGLCLAAFFAEDFVRRVTGETFERWQIVPWMLPLALAFWAPIHHLVRTRRLDVVNPFIYATLTYLGPIFVVGTSLFIITGITDIPEALLINEPAQDYPLALLYTAIAIASFGLGVNLAPAGVAGRAVGTKLPAWRWPAEMLLVPGLLFFFVGGFIRFVNFATGAIGFQMVEPGPFTAAIYFLGLLFNFGQFMLWFAIFSAPRPDWRYIGVGTMMLILLPLFAAFAGSRGYLFSTWLIAVLAYFTTGRKPTVRSVAFLAVLGALSLSLGIAFGSAFRALKADAVVAAAAKAGADTARPTVRPPTVEELARMTQHRVTAGEQLELARAAAVTVAAGGMVARTLRGVASRLNTLTQLTVVVSNRKALADKLPATLGSGIWIGLATALIPRAIWPDKPIIGDSHSYGTLFFRFSTNSFAMTPFGDLLINFGPLGIAPGMFLLGALMRVFYAGLIEQSPGAVGRAGIYVLLLTQLSMEGSFGTIIPWLLRTGLIAVLAVLITAALVALSSRYRVSQA